MAKNVNIPILSLPQIIKLPQHPHIIHRSRRVAIPQGLRPHLKSSSYSVSFKDPTALRKLHQNTLQSLVGTIPISTLPKTKPKSKFLNSDRLQPPNSPKQKTVLYRPQNRKYLQGLNRDDGSEFLKQEICLSDTRVKNIKAGKALNFVFQLKQKEFVPPSKDLYNKHRLGTPQEIPNKQIKYTGRKRHLSLINSSPHRPLLHLPSLKDIILNAGAKKKDMFDQETLEFKLNKLEKTLDKKPEQVRVGRNASHDLEETLQKIGNVQPNWFQLYQDEVHKDPVFNLFERCKEFEIKKNKLKHKLKDTIATMIYDRSEAIKLKKKHFNMNTRNITQQGMIVDIWNMRLNSEKERLDKYRILHPKVVWYKELLEFTIEQCPEITPCTYFLLDYIRSLIAQAVPFDKLDMVEAFKQIPNEEVTKGVKVLMNKIMNDLV